MALDIKLFYFLNNLSGYSYIFDFSVIFLAEYLQYFLVVLFLLLLYFSQYAKKDKLHIFWVTFIAAIVARFGVTELIRFFYHRHRPFVTLQVYQLFQDT